MITNGTKNPTLSEAIEYVILQQIATHNYGIPGSIISYDDKKGLAEVQIDLNQLLETGEQIKIAPLVNVPVERYRSNGGLSYIKIPIKPKDKGWVKFSQRSIDGWIVDGKQQDMEDVRMLDLSDAVFSPGIYPSNNQPAENNTDMVIRHEGSTHTIKDDVHELTTKNGGVLRINGPKISIGTESVEFLSLFNDLLTQLLISFGVSPVGPAPLDPVSVTKLTEIQVQLATILET